MKLTIKMIGFCFLALAFMAAPAYANRVDVANTTGFGTSVVSPTTFTLPGPDFSIDVTVQVFWDGVSTYTYVYTLSNSTSATPVETFSLASGLFGSNSSLNYGTVGSNPGVGLDAPDVTAFGVPKVNCGNGHTGNFPCVPSVNFFFSNGSGTSGGLHIGETLTIYLQSNFGPGGLPGSTIPAIAVDTDYASGNVIGPTAVPEPGTMALLGSGMVGLAFALRRRLLG
jgi:hypothetical protein